MSIFYHLNPLNTMTLKVLQITHVHVLNLGHKEKEYVVTVAYDSEYLLDFSTSEFKECAEELLSILDKHSFKFSEEDWG